jgi:hypothetical protein
MTLLLMREWRSACRHVVTQAGNAFQRSVASDVHWNLGNEIETWMVMVGFYAVGARPACDPAGPYAGRQWRTM